MNINQIKLLVSSLPLKDVPLGLLFLDKRDFLSLIDLTNSAIIKINKNLKTTTPKLEYLSIDINKLYCLQAELDSYLLLTDYE